MDSKPQPETAAAAAGTSSGAGGAGTGSGSDRPRRIIKRYSNRKLYDTKDSRYVTLLQIAEMVRTGEEVQIIDNNTKEDLTEVTLAQIIYEEQKQKASSSRNVPLQTLKELIHQRTEKVLSDLREGPIGRLIPGSKGEPGKPGEGGTPAPPQVQENGTAPSSATMQAAAPVASPGTGSGSANPAAPGAAAKPSLVDQAKETLEDWQHKIDERVKAVVPNLLPWQQLQLEIKRLNSRIEELEEQIKTLQKR